MQPKSDAQLLREYADHGKESAFADIVARHTSLVFSAALRRLDSKDAAAEVAQNVFIGLARRARPLSLTLDRNASLAGWLCRSARNLSLNLRRDEFRRQSRERQAMENLDPTPDPAPDWETLRPVLDEAMDELTEPDYDALVMRFFKNQDLRSVGQALGVSDDAAQKRIGRAVKRLRELFAKRGITVGASALTAVISANAVQSAPAGLAVSISKAAALAGTNLAAATATATTAKAIAMTTLQKTIIGATLAAAIGTGINESRQAALLRNQVETLQLENAAQRSELERERDNAGIRLAAWQEERNRFDDNSSELLALRAEVSRLRARQQEIAGPGIAAQLPSDSPDPGERTSSDDGELPRDSWTDAGFDTPHAALRTRGWAVVNGNRERFKESLHITAGARKILEDMFIEMAETSNDPRKAEYIQEILNKGYGVEEGFLMPMMGEDQTKGYTGYRILSEHTPADGEMILEIDIGFSSAPARTERFLFRRFGRDWKIVIDEAYLETMR